MAERKDAVRSVEAGRQRIVRDDYTGKLVSANTGLLQLLLDAGYVPVVAPLALGTHAERLNVDGDRAAAFLAASLGATTLLILSNVPGLLASFPDESSLVRHVSPSQLDWAESLAQGRMKKKVLAAREAFPAAWPKSSWPISRLAEPIRTALAGGGTWISTAMADITTNADSGEIRWHH